MHSVPDDDTLPTRGCPVSAANHSGNKSRQYEAFLTVAQTFASKEADEAFLAALQRILPARNG